MLQKRELELIDLLRVVWGHWKLIGSVTAAAVAVSLVLGAVSPKVYRGTTILEVGKVYSFYKGDQQEKVELIEDARNVESIFKNDAILQLLKNKLGIKESVKTLRDKIKIDGKTSPLIIMSLELDDPKAIADGLTFLADFIVKDHTKKHEVALKTLNNNIEALHAKIGKLEAKIEENEKKKAQIQEKIVNIQRQVAVEREQNKTDSGYRAQVVEQLKKARETVAEIKGKTSHLDPKGATPLELLFLQNTSQNHENRVADYEREVNELRQRESERQKQIAERSKAVADLEISINDLEAQNADLGGQMSDMKRGIAGYENFIAASTPTGFRVDPLVLDRPVSPQPVLLVVMFGAAGFLSALLLAFLIEYLKRVGPISRPETST
ncbi:MAG: hypothetical protein HY897_12950 [Deltaproteobacteria bacterium]|nr:hypothetical protein [Deltaproteobacteria bacterium]